MPDLPAFARFERVEEVAIPVVEPVLDKNLQHHNDDQKGEQGPRRPAPPEATAVFQKRRMTTRADAVSIDMTYRLARGRGCSFASLAKLINPAKAGVG